MVEFVLEEGLTDEEAVSLIQMEPSNKSSRGDGWKESAGDAVQSMRLDDYGNQAIDEDPFTAKLLSFEVGFFLCYSCAPRPMPHWVIYRQPVPDNL